MLDKTLMAVACVLSLSAWCAPQAHATQIAPTLVNLSDEVVKGWNSPVSLLDIDAAVTDPDSANFDTGALTVSFVSSKGTPITANDHLTILPAGTGAGQINWVGTDVRFGSISIGTWNGGTVTGSDTLTVTFKATATPAVVQALVRRIAYRNSSPTLNLSDKTVRYQLTDGDGGTSVAIHKMIKRIAVPVLDNLSDVTTKVWNNSPSLVDTDATVADADQTTFGNGVLTVKLVALGGSTVTLNDHLSISSEGTGPGQINIVGKDVRSGSTSIGTWNGATVTGTGVLTVTLKSAAGTTAVQALIRRIIYRNSSATQVLGNKTIQYQLSDGTGGTSLPANKTVQLID